MRHFWRISSAISPSRSRSVRLCAKNARSVTSGRGRPRTHDPDEPRRFDCRDGKKQVSAFVTKAQWRTLRNVATKTERSHSDLIAEALDDLAEKYGEQAQEPGGQKSSPRGPAPERYGLTNVGRKYLILIVAKVR
jgi:hypothetical protein